MQEYLSLDQEKKGALRRGGSCSFYFAPFALCDIGAQVRGAFMRKARSIVHDEEAAEDIVQEPSPRSTSTQPSLKTVEGATFSSWGYRILINTALTHYMRRKRRGEMTVELDEEIWNLIPDKNLRQFEKREFMDEVSSVLSRMSPLFAKALSSFFLEGKSQEEMAKAEGVSVGAIKTRVHRAKKEFRKVLKQ
jgi:RNA polymerase sigma-70 factor (ECF subfamily)